MQLVDGGYLHSKWLSIFSLNGIKRKGKACPVFQSPHKPDFQGINKFEIFQT